MPTIAELSKQPEQNTPPPTLTHLPPPSPKPKINAFSSPNEIVTFVIGTGEDEERFAIHKEVACRHSEIWDRAFNGPFIEGQTQTYRLEDVDPKVFRMLMQWVYQEKFDHAHSLQRDGWIKECGGETRKLCAKEDILLVKLWILAEKFLIRRLQNYTMNIMFKHETRCGAMNSGCYQYLYRNTANDSMLRSFAVEQKCWTGPKLSPSAVDSGHYPAQMLNDMVVVLQGQLPMNVKNKKRINFEENKGRYLVEEA
ncbi:hypothetical protein NHQ30_000268 [Ciborinia camelliae]|nr:hypothetical protein NHQ30_000268 [Ciborinia camelliae]